MKKVLIGLFAIIICLSITGCGNSNDSVNDNNTKNNSNKLSCTKTSTDEDGYKTESKIVVNYKDNKVTNVKQEDIQAMDESMIEFTYSFGQLFTEAFKSIDGINATYEKVNNNSIKSVVEVDYTKLDVNAIKEALGDMDTEDALFNKSDITLDEFKTDYLDGYTCK